MTEETAAAFQREGNIAFPTESTEEDTSAASQAENENQDEGTQSAEGDKNTRTEQDTPFHEHPRWTQREDEWNKRFNDQELRHQEDLKGIREEFGTKRQENAEATKIPVWFGGTQEQWNAYRADQERDLRAAEDRAITRLSKEREETTKKEEKAVADATAYLRSEIATIEGDKTLHPSGSQVEAEKILKVVLDNTLVDTQGRWNYRAGWKILNNQTAVAPASRQAINEKKEVAAATTSEARGETKPKAYMTSSDFKKDRPW